MIELLYTTSALLVVIFPFFFLFKEFKPLKLALIFFQFILSVIFLSDNFYKDQSLYKDPNFNNIQSTDFKPIISLYETIDDDGFKTISFDTMDNPEFSLTKTQQYSIKCFENYYITTIETCPINDIKLGNKNDKIYDDYIQINDNEYIYYTKENNLPKLYKQFKYSDFKSNEDYNAFSLDTIIRTEFNKLSNPIYDFKSYIQFCDVVCLLLILFSFFLTIPEPLNVRKCDYGRLFNYGSQIIIIVLQILRFIKFVDVKNFFFDNEDIYNKQNENYFPTKIFNIDSFLLALSFDIFLYNALCACFPNKVACCETPKCCGSDNDDSKSNCSLFAGLMPLIVVYAIYFTLIIFDILNDEKIVDIYNNMIYNWDMNPILSIEKKNIDDGSGADFLWKSNPFKIERLNNYDYINIFQNKNGKICGKDNYGNNLYFPNDVDCPINKIYFSDKNEDLIGYEKIELNNGNYLYYSNEFVEEKIIIDFRISPDLKIPFNPEYDDQLTNIPFYEEIDSEENSYLYSINYLGINTTSISGDKIKKFKHNMKVYKSLSKGKLALFCLFHIFFIFILIYSCLESSCPDFVAIFGVCSGICLIIVYLLKLIFIIICLNNHIKYITNFMNKLNLDFQREKNDYLWNLILLIYHASLALYIIIIMCSSKGDKNNILKKVEKNNTTANNTTTHNINDDKIKELEKKIEDKNKEINGLKEQIKNQDGTNDILTINNNASEINRLKDELEKKQMQLDDANKKLIENLDLIHQKEKRIKILEEGIPFDLKEGERLMCVIFQSFTDQTIHYPFLCTNKQIFNHLENKLYEKLPEYKQTNNYFISNGTNINKYQTMEENNLQDGAIICMGIDEFN